MQPRSISFAPAARAVMEGDLAKVISLIKAGADVNAVAKGRGAHYTPLYNCAYRGFAGGLELLLSKGATLGPARESDGHTALMEAARDGSYAVVEKLIAAGADIHAAHTDDGKTALHLAAGAGRGDVVKLLADLIEKTEAFIDAARPRFAAPICMEDLIEKDAADRAADPVKAALLDCIGALSACMDQIHQMRGMFDDADGTIQDALDAAEDAEKKAREAIG